MQDRVLEQTLLKKIEGAGQKNYWAVVSLPHSVTEYGLMWKMKDRCGDTLQLKLSPKELVVGGSLLTTLPSGRQCVLPQGDS